MAKERLRIGLIGCGKVGISFTGLLKHFSMIGIYDRNPRKIRVAKRFLKKGKVDPEVMIGRADVILIATQDNQIEQIAKSLRRENFSKTLVHFSGALSSKILGQKNRVSIHPLGSFADLSISMTRMRQSTFVIEGDLLGLRAAKKLIKSFGGHYQIIDHKDKPYYHLACVFGSNLLLALFAMAERIIHERKLKIDIYPLVESTIENLNSLGVKKAVTGPLVRGDIETIRKHVKILKKMGIDYRIIYYILSREIINLGSSEKDNLLSAELTALFKHQKVDSGR